MAKVRVYELAKELDLANKELIALLAERGVEVKSHSSSITEEQAAEVRASIGEAHRGETPPDEELPEQRPVADGDAVADAVPDVDEPAVVSEVVEEPIAADTEEVPDAATGSSIVLERGATVQDFAEAVDLTPANVVKALLELGEMKTVTQSMTDEEIELVADSLALDVQIVSPAEAEAENVAAEDAELAVSANAVARPPVVTVMGHVDHGKTSILDVIRNTRVAAREAGGITQHIGAYQVSIDGSMITFVDTPGHEAFTAMRARGALVTDIAILVVAADDGVMPQTVEAISHARAAGVPIVVAVNKIDKENADPARVRQQMSEHELVPSEWGGETEFVDVSAREDLNIEGLLETINVVAELEELKADPTVPARGVVIEAHLDKGRGPVATVIVRQGTLRRGDIVAAGSSFGKVRAMLDDEGKPLDEAPPAAPAQILGLQSVPGAGEEFRVEADERAARQVAETRDEAERKADLVTAPAALTLEGLFDQVQAGEVNEFVLLLKADVQGSLEAVTDAISKLGSAEVKVNIVHRAVGAISESDVQLAAASHGLIIGFNVRPDKNARALAEKEGVEVRTYRVIYELVEEVERALKGMLEPEFAEKLTGTAEVRQVFRVPRLGSVAGSYVQEGKIPRSSKARVIRDGTVVYDGQIASLRRFKENVNEVASGYECGIGLENFPDVKEGDVVETYELVEVPR